MRRYFIDVIDGGTRHDDVVGDLAPIEQVRADAVLALLDLFRQDLAGLERRIASALVRDDVGEVVYTATLTFMGKAGSQVDS